MRARVETQSAGGLVLGRYRIVRRLAQGGMGVVYLGRVEGAAGFSKPVVIKQVIPDVENAEETTARFIREAQILSNLHHPGIVSVMDFGEEVGGHCMVLEYVHGYDLSKWLKYLQLKNTPLDWESAISILVRVLDGLKYAHTFRRSDGTCAEILHRDVSPGNILLDVDGRVRLADFGIARMEENDTDQYKTQTGILHGKVTYLAPELFASGGPSPASDVYACGVVLYQMLTWNSPFAAEDKNKIMWRLLTDKATPLTDFRKDLPANLVSTAMHALEKEPNHRYQSAAEFAEDLRACLTRSESAISTDLQKKIHTDFTGDLAQLLKLDPLAERDKAWRTATGLSKAPSTSVGSTSAKPNSRHDQVTARPPTRSLGPTPLVPAPDAETDTVVQSVTMPESPSVELRSQARPVQIKHIVGVGLGVAAIVAGAVVAALVILRPATPPAAEEHFIVVGDRKAAAPAAQPSSEVEPHKAPSEPKLGEPKGGAPKAVAPKRTKKRRKPVKESTTAALARQVGKSHAALHQCFKSNASSVQGQPLIHLKFSLDAAGKATSIGLKPTSLTSTGLGQCLLQVARKTRFEPQGKAVSFSIPIRARKGK